MTPDELNAIDEESRLVALCIGPDEPDWAGYDDCTWTALDWLAVHANLPGLEFHSPSRGWVARAGLSIGDPGFPEIQTEAFHARSPWLALLKLVAAVQLHKRGELDL